jgi:hypothetical protein
MGTLTDKVTDPAKRKTVIEDAIRVIDAEVSDKTGISGMALKGAYAMAKGVAPGIINKALDNLMDDFLNALEPYYLESQTKGVDLRAMLDSRRSEAANALLAITDGRAARESGGALKKGYEKLRPTAQKHVEAAIPRLSDLISKIAS